jgi:phage gp29-like protein
MARSHRWKRYAETPLRHALREPAPLPDEMPSGKTQAETIDIFTNYEGHPGRGLTVQSLVTIFDEADRGWPQRQCDLFKDMLEIEGQLRSQVQLRKLSVLGKPWQIQAGEGGDKPEDARVAKLLELKLREVPNVRAAMAHTLKAPLWGYAGVNVVWRLDPDGIVAPKWFQIVPMRRFRFEEVTDDPRIITTANNWDGEKLRPGEWIFSTCDDDEQATRAGLLRVIAWLVMFKRWAMRDWVIFCERFGIPYVTGEYNERASPEDKAILKKAVTQLGRDGAGVFAQTCKIVVHEMSKGGGPQDVQATLCRYMDELISKLVRGATLGSDVGGAGSYAQASVHASTSFDITASDATFLSDSWGASICKQFVHYNGFQCVVPKARIHVMREVDPKTRAEILDILVNKLGLKLDADQVRQEFYVKAPTGEALERAPEPAPAAPPASGKKAPPAGD